jgi:hypothetical protein
VHQQRTQQQITCQGSSTSPPTTIIRAKTTPKATVIGVDQHQQQQGNGVAAAQTEGCCDQRLSSLKKKVLQDNREEYLIHLVCNQIQRYLCRVVRKVGPAEVEAEIQADVAPPDAQIVNWLRMGSIEIAVAIPIGNGGLI